MTDDRRIWVTFDDLARDRSIHPRQGGIDRQHAATIRTDMRNGNRPPPPVVWREAEGDKWTVVDGFHRLAALKELQPDDKFTVEVFRGSRKEAILEALKRNAMGILPLTNAERWDAAWRLVRGVGGTFSKSEIAKTTRVSNGTVGNMRKQWAEMQASGVVATGVWMKDRAGAAGDFEPMTDEERQARMEALVKGLRTLLGPTLKTDEQLAYAAFAEAIGDYRTSHMLDYLRPDDGEESMTDFPHPGDDDPDMLNF